MPVSLRCFPSPLLKIMSRVETVRPLPLDCRGVRKHSMVLVATLTTMDSGYHVDTYDYELYYTKHGKVGENIIFAFS